MKLDFSNVKSKEDVDAVMKEASPQFQALKEFAAKLQVQTSKVEEFLNDGVVAGHLHEVMPPVKRKLACVKHMKMEAKDLLLDNLRAATDGRPDRACPPGTYTSLFVRDSEETPWTLMMSDTPYEMRAGGEFRRNAHGDVLVIGLGLGATLIPVLKKRKVRSVLVVEKNPDVIEIVEPSLLRILSKDGLAGKLQVVQGDGFTWRAPRGVLFDTIWLDIWPTISQSNLPDILKLKRRYKRRLNRFYNKKSWIGAWEESYLRQCEREDKARPDPLAAIGGKITSTVEVDGREVRI